MSKHLAGCVCVDLYIHWTSIVTDSDLCVGRPISFLKMTCTQMAQETAKDAVQIYGGRGTY